MIAVENWLNIFTNGWVISGLISALYLKFFWKSGFQFKHILIITLGWIVATIIPNSLGLLRLLWAPDSFINIILIVLVSIFIAAVGAGVMLGQIIIAIRKSTN